MPIQPNEYLYSPVGTEPPGNNNNEGDVVSFNLSHGDLHNQESVESDFDQQAKDQTVVERQSWDNKVQFYLSVISMAVGLGNIWRFPYLCQENGGGAFLIPYFTMMVLEGIPVFLIELGIGQKLRSGPIGVWNKIHPYLGGVGISSAVVSFFVALYYNVIITWILFYLAHCFQNPLPWKDCPMQQFANGTSVVVAECDRSSETAYFWFREAVDASPSIGELGHINWKMLICLILAWLIVFVCMCRGIKTSGKVMYLTATFPYVIMTIFFVRAVLLPGSAEGILYLLYPQMDRLGDPRVWLDAAAQVFFSLGLAFGGLIAFASYNPVQNNCKRDVLVLSATNVFTSMFSAVIIFAVLGYKSHTQFEKCQSRNLELLCQYYPLKNCSSVDYSLFLELESSNFAQFPLLINRTSHCDFQEILQSSDAGTGLAFVAFTQAMIEFPGAQFWAVLFFLMLFSLGLGSMFGTLEGCIASLEDLQLFPWLKKPILVGIVCSISLLIGLIFVTQAGEYWVKLFDTFSGSYGLMVIAVMETIAVSYVYGWRKFCDDIKSMTGYQPNWYWTTTWRFIAPGIMIVLFIASLGMSIVEPPTYHPYLAEKGGTEKTPYPGWAMAFAGLLVFLAMAPMPLVFFLRYFKILKMETDIPTAVRLLGTSVSTTGILKGVESVASDMEGPKRAEGRFLPDLVVTKSLIKRLSTSN